MWQDKTIGWVHDEENIKGFFGEYRWPSNFHKCPILYQGITYPSTENAYQAAKSTIPHVRRGFVEIQPSEARKRGRAIEIRPYWEGMKLDVMLEINRIKYHDHLQLREKLIATGSKYLEETNWWHDCTWGVCNCEKCKDKPKENNLGKILMAIRDIIK